jgi:hypothetical protein
MVLRTLPRNVSVVVRSSLTSQPTSTRLAASRSDIYAMAELAALQVAASIIQVIDVGIRISERLKDFHDKSHALPSTFKHINNKLPIFIDALRQTKEAMETMTDSARKAFRPVIEECYMQITRLEATVDAVLPKRGDTGRMRSWKAIISLKHDDEVKEMERVIQVYMAVMAQHHTSSLAMQSLNSKLAAFTNRPSMQLLD